MSTLIKSDPRLSFSSLPGPMIEAKQALEMAFEAIRELGNSAIERVAPGVAEFNLQINALSATNVDNSDPLPEPRKIPDPKFPDLPIGFVREGEGSYEIVTNEYFKFESVYQLTGIRSRGPAPHLDDVPSAFNRDSADMHIVDWCKEAHTTQILIDTLNTTLSEARKLHLGSIDYGMTTRMTAIQARIDQIQMERQQLLEKVSKLNTEEEAQQQEQEAVKERRANVSMQRLTIGTDYEAQKMSMMALQADRQQVLQHITTPGCVVQRFPLHPDDQDKALTVIRGPWQGQHPNPRGQNYPTGLVTESRSAAVAEPNDATDVWNIPSDDEGSSTNRIATPNKKRKISPGQEDWKPHSSKRGQKSSASNNSRKANRSTQKPPRKSSTKAILSKLLTQLRTNDADSEEVVKNILDQLAPDARASAVRSLNSTYNTVQTKDNVLLSPPSELTTSFPAATEADKMVDTDSEIEVAPSLEVPMACMS